MALEAVIFDWDGVLFDSARANYEAYLAVLEKLGLSKITFSRFRGLWEADYRKFEAKTGITRDKRHISDKVWMDSYTKLMGGVNIFPGAENFLSKVKKDFKIGLVTVGSQGRITKEIGRFKLGKVFDSIVTAEDTKKFKPDPEGLLICASKLGVKPAGCVYVGDSKGDVLAARNAGMLPVAVAWGYHDISVLEEAEPEYVAKNFDELYNAIMEIKSSE